LSSIHGKSFEKEGVEVHDGCAKLLSPNEVEATREDGSTYTLTEENISISVGSNLTIPSDEKSLVRRLSSTPTASSTWRTSSVYTPSPEAQIAICRDKVLRTFSPMEKDVFIARMQKTGVNNNKNTNVVKVEDQKGGLEGIGV
jgi:glutathione reductase (NADPH)